MKIDLEPTPLPAEHGYARGVVDEFVVAADAEGARLRGVIADANRREMQARAALSAHEVMLAMLLDAQRELAARRRSAELEAEAILDDADREAGAIVAAALPTTAEPVDLQAGPASSQQVTIDLAGIEERAEYHRLPDVPAGANSTNGMFVGADGHPSVVVGGDESYFAFLRGALVDDEPLGPRSE